MPPTNILLITGDQQHYHTLGVTNPLIHTPSLDRLGIAENTLVVYSTDHGHLMGQHGLTAKGAFH